MPSLAVWKFASCDGCQLTLLDCEDELLAIADAVQIGHFLEASSAVVKGPYDVSLVEGSITTEADRQRIQRVREQSGLLVTIGACATAGGIQALRNAVDEPAWRASVYPEPGFVSSLATATPIAEHVVVDAELRGCPIAPGQLLELLTALRVGRRPQLPVESVCQSCKRAGNVCVLVADGIPCLGPVTQAGCGALCPAFGRGCYACFGPREEANVTSLHGWLSELPLIDDPDRLFAGFTGWAPPFRALASRAVIAAEPVAEEATDA
jgi:sulfhydrogenase subunit delta